MRCVGVSTLLVVLMVTVLPSEAGIFDDIMNQIKGMFSNYEETPFEVITNGNGYQERQYPARKWVCKTETLNQQAGDDLSHLFWPLFNYINGQNSRNEKIPMTVPVTTKFEASSPGNKMYQMCFFLGEDYQADPPQPIQGNNNLSIVERPAMRIVTRTVGGYITNEMSWLEEAGKLAAVLQENGISVNLQEMYWVGYDSPMKFWNRRNEVWFPIGN